MQNQTVLITGACGFVGSHLLQHLCKTNKVVALDSNENGLHALHVEHSFVVEIGSIEDEVFVNYVFAKYRPDTVIHCAARKHVLTGEQNPSETMRVNVGGTLNIFSAASHYGCSTCILLSTDKADKPVNVYGESKALCEKLVKTFSQLSSCRYLTIRFCNIYGSSGSVAEIFLDRIRNNKPIKITTSAKRYFITVDKVIKYIDQTYDQGISGATYMVDDCVEMSIEDIARHIAAELDVEFESLDVTYVDCPHYEKLHEDYSKSSCVHLLN